MDYKNSCWLILLLLLAGCNAQTLDLQSVNFKQTTADELEFLKCGKLENQKGHWVLKKKGDNLDVVLEGDESSKHYYLRTPEEIAQLSYGDFTLDSEIGAKLVSYQNQLAFINLSFIETQTFEVLNYLTQTYGTPDQTFMTISYRENDPRVQQLLKNFELGKNLKEFEDDYGDKKLSYPYQNIWVNNGFIYQFTLSDGVDSFHNSLMIISINSLKDQIIFGYHNPDQDPILSKYLK